MTGDRAAAALRLALAGSLLMLGALPAAARAEDPEPLEEGRALYLDNCASCHGAELEGQPDWKRRLPSGRMPAPPQDASDHTWHHTDRMLFAIIKRGPAAVIGQGYESDMPAFEGTLADEQIRMVRDYIKSTWPERERQYQEERSRAEREVER